MKAKEITKILHDVRKIKHISQTQLGTSMGIVSVQISSYEIGKCSPQMNRVIEWADKLGMKIVLRPKNK